MYFGLLGLADLVVAVLVAVAARQIALIGDVQHDPLQREINRGSFGGSGIASPVRITSACSSSSKAVWISRGA